MIIELPSIATEAPSRPLDCQLDGSWHTSDPLSGHGWIVIEEGKPIYLGLKGVRKSLSPLHDELDSLLWAIRCMILISLTSIRFAMDCADLITMVTSPLDWPTFASEMDDFISLKSSFPSFTIVYIFRCYNVHADCFAKK